jgi:AraC-like DNA-binding protein
VKHLVESELTHGEGDINNLAYLLTQKLGSPYDSVSVLFYYTEGVRLEKYALAKRMEKAQYLLRHTNVSLKEVAAKLGYSHVRHLSAAFKSSTGMSPSQYRELKAWIE